MNHAGASEWEASQLNSAHIKHLREMDEDRLKKHPDYCTWCDIISISIHNFTIGEDKNITCILYTR